MKYSAYMSRVIRKMNSLIQDSASVLAGEAGCSEVPDKEYFALQRYNEPLAKETDQKSRALATAGCFEIGLKALLDAATALSVPFSDNDLSQKAFDKTQTRNMKVLLKNSNPFLAAGGGVYLTKILIGFIISEDNDPEDLDARSTLGYLSRSIDENLRPLVSEHLWNHIDGQLDRLSSSFREFQEEAGDDFELSHEEVSFEAPGIRFRNAVASNLLMGMLMAFPGDVLETLPALRDTLGLPEESLLDPTNPVVTEWRYFSDLPAPEVFNSGVARALEFGQTVFRS